MTTKTELANMIENNIAAMESAVANNEKLVKKLPVAKAEILLAVNYGLSLQVKAAQNLLNQTRHEAHHKRK